MDEAQSSGSSPAQPAEKGGAGRVELPESDADLLAECEVETFRAGGPGGQHQNKTESAVRLRHRPSGMVVTCRQDRSQFQNKNICLKRLRAKVARLNETPPE
jgi:protein subunit release factor B